jgi:hypothetical protein
MSDLSNPGRRGLLRKVAAALSIAPLALPLEPAQGADLPLLEESDPRAKALDYVADVSRAKGAADGSNCANCSVYAAHGDATSGTCQLFPGKLVPAAGWCRGWSGL